MISDPTKTPLNGEVLPTPPAKSVFVVQYEVTLTGELSGSVVVSGEMAREAVDSGTAYTEVFQFLNKAPGAMFPKLEGGRLVLFTPEFPPEFSGRMLKSVVVWINIDASTVWDCRINKRCIEPTRLEENVK